MREFCPESVELEVGVGEICRRQVEAYASYSCSSQDLRDILNEFLEL
jgi:hypothetical protein